MNLLLLLLACGSGDSVTITTESMPDYPLPGTLAPVLEQVQRPVKTCYADALKADSALAGTVRVEASGSHGVIKVEVVEPAPAPLAGCLKSILSGQKLARELVDGDIIVGVVFVVKFGG